jgi:hypothetical protein
MLMFGWYECSTKKIVGYDTPASSERAEQTVTRKNSCRNSFRMNRTQQMECMELNIGIVRTFSSLKMTLGVSMEQKTMVQNSVREGRGFAGRWWQMEMRENFKTIVWLWGLILTPRITPRSKVL